MASVHEQCLLGVVATIQGLALQLPDGSGLPDGRVYLREVPKELNVTLPCVIVSLSPDAEEAEGGTNAAEDFGYPCWVTVLAKANQELPLGLNDHRLNWRQQIRDAFRYQRPTAIEAAVSVPLRYCRWQPLPVLNATAYDANNLFASTAIVWVLTRELR